MKQYSIALALLMVCAAFGAMVPANSSGSNDKSWAKQDSDHDGLTNLEEYRLGCDPLDPDTDHDGLPDGWEAHYRLEPAMYDYDGDGTPDRTFVGDVIRGYAQDPTDPKDALEDPDDDGLTNLEEYRLGTDPTNPNTDWDRWIKDSLDPEPLIPDPGYNAIFGGSIYNPWAGPGINGRGTESEATAANAASEAFQGNGKAPDLARSFMASIPVRGNGAGQGSARSMSGDGGRSMKYVTRIILDGSLPAVVEKGDPFTVSGHVEYTTVQVDDGNDNGNDGQDPGQGDGNGTSPGGGDGYDNGHGDYPGGGHGPGGTGPDPGKGGSDLPIFYWYWWHGPADTGGRGGVSGRSGDELKWYPIDQAMAITIQLNTTQGNYKIGSGLADLQVEDVYGHFTITCIIPGAAPAGEGKIAVHAIANSYYAGSWWEEGRDG